ncbi:MAG: enoyl-ACP reductase [Arenicellales bacterium]|jgi:enoyl-[acyl-carrier protein] reductase I|nr:enoyl-[acyl-carrier-protein] reductase FabI [Acidiferrobacteraceae bacterium]MDP6123408.1 enoyl-ACP reductase [Arenicellales bacterium]MBT58684.1 enoyl-[acyl-carrier-protein] reductase FabI [Acidiferrobacteraceae bacterium]MDP6290236.1 enoyl-ACP reductase [Arenicellales bacterium]MDP6434120.1 enoyl-ACP reductase [Arenicellales bacterium]|tara:strand:+ start:460 stop:1260 length:801 start_codon:yes stop_codon:yes gene_type:complete
MGFLNGKRALIVGVASDRSIAWGIAKAMHREGAEIAFTYQTEKLKPRVEKLAAHADSDIVIPCDVSSDEEIDALYGELDNYWDGFDILVHSVAFAPRETLEGLYLDSVSRDGFNAAHEISSYSFAALGKAARPMMANRGGGAMLTLSYIGAVRSMPGYNVMGLAKASLEANVRYMAQSLGRENIRVNGISAGPIRTLAAMGIKGFRKMMHYYEKAVPLGRSVTTDEVGNTGAFLCSDLASGITGEITYVDGGFNTVGLSEGLLSEE